MLKKKSLFSKNLLFPLMLVLLVFLAACSSDKEKNEVKEPAATEEAQKETAAPTETAKPVADDGTYSIDDFTNTKTNEGTAIKGGSITYGLVSDTPFEGSINFAFYDGEPDREVIQWFDESLVDIDSSYVMTNKGAATYEVSEDGKTFTFTIKDNVNWHDGKPVKAEDWQFAYEIIGHPKYDGTRYNESFSNVVGMAEYHEGKAKTISGIEVVSEKVIKFTFITANPSLLTGGVWPYPLAKHIFGSMEVDKISASPELRVKPIGFGPFKVKSIVPGESVVFEKNADYWRGEPSLDQVILKVVNPTVVAKEVESGGVDLVGSFPSDQFPKNSNLSNVQFLATIEDSYNYVGFKMGKWDEAKEEVAYDPNAKMSDVNLRKAMWHAVDNDAVGNKFYHGLRWSAGTLIPPYFPEYHDASNKGLTYDVELANKILDDAGYKKDGEFRTKPDGSPLEIKFLSMSGGDIAEPLSQYYVQSWKAIGLNVKVELVEFNAFYERVGSSGKDDPSVDVYAGAWGTGTDVDPAGLYSRKAMYNFPRYANEENDKLLADGLSLAAFDKEYRKDVYKKWQQLMVEEIPVFPTLYRAILVPVNKRVQNYTLATGTDIQLYQLAVTQDKPFVAGK